MKLRTLLTMRRPSGRRPALGVAMALLLGACGQTGVLYQPPPPADENASAASADGAVSMRAPATPATTSPAN